MPRWTPIDLTGLLLRDGDRLALRPDGGGEWRLDAGGKYAALVGQRVRVTGVRAGFDLVDVKTMVRAA